MKNPLGWLELQVDWERRRVWVRKRRIHHGPVGAVVGLLIAVAAVASDWPDRADWLSDLICPQSPAVGVPAARITILEGRKDDGKAVA